MRRQIRRSGCGRHRIAQLLRQSIAKQIRGDPAGCLQRGSLKYRSQLVDRQNARRVTGRERRIGDGMFRGQRHAAVRHPKRPRKNRTVYRSGRFQVQINGAGWHCGLRIADCGLRVADCGWDETLDERKVGQRSAQRGRQPGRSWLTERAGHRQRRAAARQTQIAHTRDAAVVLELRRLCELHALVIGVDDEPIEIGGHVEVRQPVASTNGGDPKRGRAG